MSSLGYNHRHPMPSAPFTSSIIGTGSALPERIVTNEELAAQTGLSPAMIAARTGIRTRRWAAPVQASSDLAIRAAESALKHAGCTAGELDAIIVSTTSPDYFFPSTACLVQRALHAERAAAFDVAASCTGFLAALSVGDQWIRTGSARRVLVIAAEIKSRVLDPEDPATAILFGDGAGAAVLAPTGSCETGQMAVQAIRLGADGSGHSLIHLPAGGSRRPVSAESLAAGLHTMRMRGPAVYRRAVTTLDRTIRQLLAEARLPLDSIALYLCHQANQRLLNHVARRLRLPPERLFTTIAETGNTSSASIPIALDQAVRRGLLHPDDRIVMAAFGGGLTWGAALLQWTR
jgi:3-oxoacyl-[acyl-carrier-protein] synthase-3